LKTRTRILLPMLVILALLVSMTSVAMPVFGATPTFTGDVEADFAGPGILIINDPIGDVGMPPGAPGITGWEMKDLRLTYDEATDTMYVGINVVSILGDADGDGNPSVTSPWLLGLGGIDLPSLNESETACVYFDLNQDLTYDIIAGISGLTDYSGFSVSTFAGPFFPPYNFGSPLPTNTGTVSPNPSPVTPDLEFSIINWSSLPGNDGDFSFCVSAFLGSLQDDGIGEDFVSYCQSPDICIEKTVDCNGDGNFSDQETWYAGDNATWKVVVTNCGDSNLTNVIVTDTNGHNFGAPFNLPYGAAPVEFTYVTVVSVNTTNNATVVATDVLGGTVSDWDIATNNVVTSDICIEKTVDCNGDGNFSDQEMWYAGDNATWKVVVTNCGGGDLTNVIVTDSNGHNFGAPFDLPYGALPVEFTYVTVVSVNTTNNATVVATDVLGGTVSDWDIATNNVIEPKICIEKTVDCNNDGIFLHEDTGTAGDNATWKVVVTNCGDSDLTNVIVTDTNGHNFGAPFDLPYGAAPVEFTYQTIVNVDTTNTANVTATDVLGGTVTDSDSATNLITGNEGCTPGYWKNNAVKWGSSAWIPTGYNKTMLLGNVFTIPACVNHGTGNNTLLQALSYKGGSGVKGAAQILLRSAVAALLNAAHPDINYYMSDPQDVIDAVNAALASCNRTTMLALYAELDLHNNDGCVLDMHGNPIIPDGDGPFTVFQSSFYSWRR